MNTDLLLQSRTPNKGTQQTKTLLRYLVIILIDSVISEDLYTRPNQKLQDTRKEMHYLFRNIQTSKDIVSTQQKNNSIYRFQVSNYFLIEHRVEDLLIMTSLI